MNQKIQPAAAFAIAVVLCGLVPAPPGGTPQDEPAIQETSSADPENPDPPVARMPSESWLEFGPPELDQIWYSSRFGLENSLYDARIHYRQGQLGAAKDEIDSAILWLRLAANNAADEQRGRELESVVVTLREVAAGLDAGRQITARELNMAFAEAQIAMAQHHFSKAHELVERAELTNAARRLIAAADYMKNAAGSADLAPNPVVGTFRDEYSPYGMVDQSLELAPQQLRDDLEIVGESLEVLGREIEDKAQKGGTNPGTVDKEPERKR